MNLKSDFPTKKLIQIARLPADTVFDGVDDLCIRTYASLGYFHEPDLLENCHVLNKRGKKALDLMKAKKAREEYFNMISDLVEKYGLRDIKYLWNETVSTETLIYKEFSLQVERWNKEHGEKEKIRIV